MNTAEKTALYPGSFDPITNGHLDIVERALKIFDRLVVAVAVNPVKETMFSKDERIALIENAIKDKERIIITSFTGLTTAFARKLGVEAIIRGLRMVSDFEYEFQMALMNRKLDSAMDTVFLMPSEQYSYLSSSLLKNIAEYDGNVDCFVPKNVAEALKKKFEKT
jgi:pantetheine-phosphate adenylyltransferase